LIPLLKHEINVHLTGDEKTKESMLLTQ